MDPNRILEGVLGGSAVAGIAYGLSLWSDNVRLKREMEDLKVRLILWQTLTVIAASAAGWMVIA